MNRAFTIFTGFVVFFYGIVGYGAVRAGDNDKAGMVITILILVRLIHRQDIDTKKIREKILDEQKRLLKLISKIEVKSE